MACFFGIEYKPVQVENKVVTNYINNDEFFADEKIVAELQELEKKQRHILRKKRSRPYYQFNEFNMVSKINSNIESLDTYFSTFNENNASPNICKFSLALFIVYVTGIRSGQASRDGNEKTESGVGLLSLKTRHINVINRDDSTYLMHLKFYGKFRILFDKTFPIPLQIAKLIDKCRGSHPESKLFSFQKIDLHQFIRKNFGLEVNLKAFRKLRISAMFEKTLNLINTNNDASLAYLTSAAEETAVFSNHSDDRNLVSYTDARIVALFLDRFSIQTSSYEAKKTYFGQLFKNIINFFLRETVNFEWALLVNKFLYSKNIKNDKYNQNIIYHQSKYWNY